MMQKWLTTLFLALCTAAVVSADDGIAAVVGDSVILESEVEEAVALRPQSGGQSDRLLQNMTYENVLSEMIESLVLTVHAEQDSMISIPDSKVRSSVDDRINSVVAENGITRDELKENLKQSYGISYDAYRDRLFSQIKNQMVMQNVQQLYLNSDLSRSEVETFYQEYRDSLPPVGKSVRFQKIRIDVGRDSLLRQRVYDSILAVREDIRAGRIAFSAAAEKYSEGPNAEKGGALGFITKGDLSLEKLEGVIFRHSPGEISHPVETRLGFHLVEVLSKGDNRVEVRQIFMPVRRDTVEAAQIRHRLDSLRQHAQSDSAFARAVAAFSDDPITKSYDGKTEWQKASSLEGELKKRFPRDNPEEGSFIGPYLKENSYYLYRIFAYNPNRRLTLEHDYSRIKEIAENVHSRDKLSELAREWRRDIYVKVYSR
ncbi:MAG: peptidylprolyl isomerase [Fibrobacterota bacterium]